MNFIEPGPTEPAGSLPASVAASAGCATTLKGTIAGNLHLCRYHGDGLALILLHPRNGGTEWWAVSTTGWRQAAFESGFVLHDPGSGGEAMSLAIAVQAVERGPGVCAGTANESYANRLPRVNDLGLPLGPAHRIMRRVTEVHRSHPLVGEFLARSGGITLQVASQGILFSNGLTALDELCGGNNVDAFFAEWPFLLKPLLKEMAAGSANFDAVLRMINARDRIEEVATHLAGWRPLDDAEDNNLDGWISVGAVKTLLKRMRGIKVHGCHLREAMVLATALPADWIPSTADEYYYFDQAAPLLWRIASDSDHALELGTLARSAKGRWTEFFERIQAGDPYGVRDMVEAFRRQLAQPALLHALACRNARKASSAKRRLVECEIAVDMFAEGGGLKQRFETFAGALAWKMLFTGKSAPAILEASQAWHEAMFSMNAEIAPRRAVRTWDTPFDRIEIGVGVALVAIGDSESLKVEGLALHHCVGGYVDACDAGGGATGAYADGAVGHGPRSVVASIRRRGSDGREYSSSTVELSGWRYGEPWTPRVLQHKGAHNTSPDPADIRDLCATLERLGSGTVMRQGPVGIPETVLAKMRRLIEAFRSRNEPGPDEAIAWSAGYDWSAPEEVTNALKQWRRFLPRDVFDSGVSRFADHAARLQSGIFLAELAARLGQARRQTPSLESLALRSISS